MPAKSERQNTKVIPFLIKIQMKPRKEKTKQIKPVSYKINVHSSEKFLFSVVCYFSTNTFELRSHLKKKIGGDIGRTPC